MSFDIPKMHIADNTPEARVLEAIISRDHISAEEAVRRAIRNLETSVVTPKATPRRRSAEPTASLSSAELSELESAFPGLTALDEVTEEQWARIDSKIRQGKRAGLSTRA